MPEGVVGKDSHVDRNLGAELESSTEDERLQPEQRRLTRAAFSKTLQQHTMDRKSVFNVKGLHRLQETFHALDLCHNPSNQWDDLDEGEEPVVSFVLHVYCILKIQKKEKLAKSFLLIYLANA